VPDGDDDSGGDWTADVQAEARRRKAIALRMRGRDGVRTTNLSAM
jgi:hypothetical protein